MPDKSNTARGGGAAPVADTPAAIRNVVLVGPSGAGKTTLVEALLVAAGVLPRAGSVVDGSTVCDFDDAEIRQQRSVGLAVAPLTRDGVKVNLIDTPGYADFVGELRAGLRAADCALFVVAANEGVDEPTRCCGTSATKSACRARWWSPNSTTHGPTTTTRWWQLRMRSATRCYRCIFLRVMV